MGRIAIGDRNLKVDFDLTAAGRTLVMQHQDDPMQRREAEKSAVLAEIAAVLDVIGRERRMPDHWERVCLFDAFTAVFAGCYGVAISQARLALIPASERSSEVRLLTDPIYDQCDLPLFTRVFQAAQSEPAHRFPHFGPVKLKEAITKDSAKSWLRQTI